MSSVAPVESGEVAPFSSHCRRRPQDVGNGNHDPQQPMVMLAPEGCAVATRYFLERLARGRVTRGQPSRQGATSRPSKVYRSPQGVRRLRRREPTDRLSVPSQYPFPKVPVGFEEGHKCAALASSPTCKHSSWLSFFLKRAAKIEMEGNMDKQIACTCYHPLFVFNQFGNLERSALRPGRHCQRKILNTCGGRGSAWIDPEKPRDINGGEMPI